ncbi:hypothetical protein ACQKDS_01250 [Serratia sp. NPDC078593]|uniref:hypothetical protein n=1 Tax=unclassified Serratia (in: enterobacteria) TaxID=2647522 RepID=UPI0037CE2DFA
MFFEKIKKYFLYIVLFVFLVGNIFLIGYDFTFKKIFIILLFSIVVITCFFQKDIFKRIIFYFVCLNDGDVVKKISGGISLLSWVCFLAVLFLLNIGFVLFARWLILAFVVCVIISGVFAFYDLERAGNITFRKLRFVFVSGAYVLYFITSAYAESYFFQMSNMGINNSPLLEVGWKIAFFAIYFFMILQPVSYGFFLWIANKLKGHQLIAVLGVLMLATFLLFAMPRWAENFIVVVLDWATSSEWHTSATCGTLNISDSTEHYFGFNTDKYTVYFSNRDGKWGFEEINCIKDDKNQDSLKRVLVSQSKMPKWFKE